MPISGVVVLFFPDKDELIKNIQSYIHHLDLLYIIDNTTGVTDLQNKLQQFSDTVIYIKNEKNLGIAAVLNTAVDLSYEKKYDWLLTMDQDSYFEPGEIESYIQTFNSDFINRTDVAIVCPQNEGHPQGQKTNSFHPVTTTITSGSLHNIGICKKLGGFDEKLFIDEVDFDYCYRCILAGYKIFQLDHVYLTHRIGKNINAGYFSVFKRSNRVIHNPTRVYYMVRNHLYMSSKYAKSFPEEFRKRRKDLRITLKNNLLFSGHFFKVLKSAIKGYIHFIQKK